MSFNKNYGIITHRLFNGAGQDLYRYLKKNDAQYLLLVQHSFSSAPDRRTSFTEFKEGNENVKQGIDYRFLPDQIVYIKDFLYSLYGILLNKNRFYLIVGCGGFNALSGLLLKWMHKCEKVVFYTIDYSPNRFSNPMMNRIYHAIDKLCVKYCDQTWNLSSRMAEGREYTNNMSIKDYPNQKVVPIGIWFEDLPEIEKKFERKTLVFVGHLLEKQGVQLVLQAIPEVKKTIKDFCFIVIGTGNYESTLRKQVQDLMIEENVVFKGPIYDSQELNSILGKSHLAVALYSREHDTFTYYADPTKIKTYLAMGLPVLITDVPHNAHEIEQNECGKLIDYDVKNVSDSIIEMFVDDCILEKYSENAKKYAHQFDWNTIFLNVLRDV